MNVKPVTTQFAVAPQITVVDLKAIATAGFKTIICHRPDGEELQQPTASEIKAVALSLGLAFHHQPVQSGKLCTTDVDDFEHLWQTSQHPILAYCRSGKRSITLWARTALRAGRQTRQEILHLARNAGYDLRDCLN